MKNTPTFDFAFHLIRKLIESNSIWEFNTVLPVGDVLRLPQFSEPIIKILMEYALSDLERHLFKKETILTHEIDIKNDFDEIVRGFCFLTGDDGLKLIRDTLGSPEILSEMRSKAALKVCHLLALEQASQLLKKQETMFSMFSSMIEWGEYPWKAFHTFFKMNIDKTAIKSLITLSAEKISAAILVNSKNLIDTPQLDMRDVLHKPFLQALESFLIERKSISSEPELYQIPLVYIEKEKSQLPPPPHSQLIFPPKEEFARFLLKGQVKLLKKAIDSNRIDILKKFYRHSVPKFIQASLNLFKQKKYQSIKPYLPDIFADYLLTAITDGIFSVHDSAYPFPPSVNRLVAQYLVDQKDGKDDVIDSLANWLTMSPAGWLYVLFNLFDHFPIKIAPNHKFNIKILSPRSSQFWLELRNIFLAQLLRIATIVEALFQCRIRFFPQKFLNLTQSFEASNPLAHPKRVFIPPKYLHQIILTFFDGLTTLSSSTHRAIIKELFYEVTDRFSDKFLFEVENFDQLLKSNNNMLVEIFICFQQYSRFPFPSAYFHLKFNHIDQAVLRCAERLTHSLYPYLFAKNQKAAIYAALEQFDMPPSFNQENYNFLVEKLARTLIEQAASECQRPDYEIAYENVFATILKKRSLGEETKKLSLRTSEQKIFTNDNWEIYAPLLTSQLEKNHFHAVEPIDPTYADLFTQLTDDKASSQQITAVLANHKNQSRLRELAKISLSEISRLLSYALLRNITPLTEFLFKNFPISLAETMLSQLLSKADMNDLSEHKDAFTQFLNFLYSKSPAEPKNLQRISNFSNYLFTEPLTYALTALRVIFWDHIYYVALGGQTENKLNWVSQLDKKLSPLDERPGFLTPLILILAYAFPCEEKISLRAMRGFLNLLAMPPSSQLFLIRKISIESNLIKIGLQLSEMHLNVETKTILFISFFISAIEISIESAWNVYLETLPHNLVKKFKSEVFSPDLRNLLSMVRNEQKSLSQALDLNHCSNQFLCRIMRVFMVKLSAHLSKVIHKIFSPAADPQIYCTPSEQSTLLPLSIEIKDIIIEICKEIEIEKQLHPHITALIITTMKAVSPGSAELKFNTHKKFINSVLKTLNTRLLNQYFSATVNTLSFILLSFPESITAKHVIQQCKATLEGIYHLIEHESLPTSSSDPRAINALSNVLVANIQILYPIFFESLKSKSSTEELFAAVYQQLIDNLIERLSRPLDEKMEEKKPTSTLEVKVEKAAYEIDKLEIGQDRNFDIYKPLIEPLSIKTVSLDFLPVEYQLEFMKLITENVVKKDIKIATLLAIPEIKQAFDKLAGSSNPEQLGRLLNWAFYSKLDSLIKFIFNNYPTILAQAMMYYPLDYAAMDNLSVASRQHFEKFINFISQQAPREDQDLNRLDLVRENKGSFNNSIEFAVAVLHDFFLEETRYVVPTLKITHNFYILSRLLRNPVASLALGKKSRPLIIIAAYAFPLEEKQAVSWLCTLMSLLSLPLEFQISLIKKVSLRLSSEIFPSLKVKMNAGIGKQLGSAAQETTVIRVLGFFWSALIASIENALNEGLKKFPQDFKPQINLNLHAHLIPLLKGNNLIRCLTMNSTEMACQVGRELVIAWQEKFTNIFSRQEYQLFQGVLDIKLIKALESEANTVIENIVKKILIRNQKHIKLTQRASDRITPLTMMNKNHLLHLNQMLSALQIQIIPLRMIDTYSDQIVAALCKIVEENQNIQPLAIYVTALKDLRLDEKEYDKEKLLRDAAPAMIHALKSNLSLLWQKFCSAFSTNHHTANESMRKIFDELFKKLIRSLESGSLSSTSDRILEISQNRAGMFGDSLMVPSSLSSSSSSSSSSCSSSSSSPAWVSGVSS